MISPLAPLEDRSHLWETHEHLLRNGSDADSPDAMAQAALRLGRALIKASVPLLEFEDCHTALVERITTQTGHPLYAGDVRRAILGLYGDELLSSRVLAKDRQSELTASRAANQNVSYHNEELATLRDTLRKEVQAKSQMLQERSVELAAVNEKLSAQRDELAGYLYSISHDVKSPVNTIKSLLSSYLEDSEDGNGDIADLRAALSTTSRTLVMLDDLFNFSQAMDSTHEDDNVDLGPLIDDLFEDVAGTASAETPILTRDPLPVVQGSKFQLRLLFQNLISNGLKFCAPDRPPEVRVVNKGARGITHTAIAVIDNGIGIEAKYHRRIFGLFRRLHAYDVYPGSGIGLALCDRIVRNHGGQIDLRSELGVGSTFVVTLPV